MKCFPLLSVSPPLYQDLNAELRRLGLKKTDLKLSGAKPIILDTINNPVDRVGGGRNEIFL